MHRLVARLLENVFLKFEIKMNSFVFCIMVYVVSYCMAHCVTLFGKKGLNNLVN